MTAEAEKKILVLGLGNILLRDEGIGVRVVERLIEQYEFLDNITLMDGGVRGMILMDPIIQADHIIVIDAVLNDQGRIDPHRLDLIGRLGGMAYTRTRDLFEMQRP